jgi:hypothetical protein
MPPKRVAPKAAGSPPSGPLATALLLSTALGYGLWLLVQRGRVSWPPGDLLANAYTLAGCLALVGPLVLARRESSGGGLGELLWMAGGILVWVFDAAAALRGGLRVVAWATPLSHQSMGLTILAILLAGWRSRAGGVGGGRDWAWTNVTGWSLGLFWVAMGLAALLGGAGLGGGVSSR